MLYLPLPSEVAWATIYLSLCFIKMQFRFSPVLYVLQPWNMDLRFKRHESVKNLSDTFCFLKKPQQIQEQFSSADCYLRPKIASNITNYFRFQHCYAGINIELFLHFHHVLIKSQVWQCFLTKESTWNMLLIIYTPLQRLSASTCTSCYSYLPRP